MRQLLVAFGLFGLVLGLAAAVVLHSLPAILVGQGSFFAFAEPSRLSAGTRITITLEWTRSLLTLGGLGLVVGVLAALVLGRLGWRLTPPAR